jgi:DNA-binding NarL/FixJ family response regulator
MDLTIPGGMGGKEAVQEILKIDPHALVVVSSGYSSDPVMSEYEKYGFKGRITKPYNLEEMGALLNDLKLV